MLFQKGFQLIVLFVHWLDKNKTQIETQHQSKKGCCKNETCLLRAIMATSTIALPQGRMKWSNCRLTTKNPDYQLGWAILAECSRLDVKTFQGCVIFCGFCAGQKPQERNTLKSLYLDTQKCNFHFMQQNFYKPYLLLRIQNIKGQSTVSPLHSSLFQQ